MYKPSSVPKVKPKKSKLERYNEQIVVAQPMRETIASVTFEKQERNTLYRLAVGNNIQALLSSFIMTNLNKDAYYDDDNVAEEDKDDSDVPFHKDYMKLTSNMLAWDQDGEFIDACNGGVGPVYVAEEIAKVLKSPEPETLMILAENTRSLSVVGYLIGSLHDNIFELDLICALLKT